MEAHESQLPGRSPAVPGEFRLGEWLVEPELDRISGPLGSSKLEPKSTQVLVALAAEWPRVCGRNELLDSVWNDAVVGDESLTRLVSLLRRALGDDKKDPRFIATVYKRGYRLLVKPEYARPAERSRVCQPAAVSVPRRRRPAAVRALIALTAAVALGAGVVGLATQQHDGTLPTGGSRSAAAGGGGADILTKVSPRGDRILILRAAAEGGDVEVFLQETGTGAVARLPIDPATRNSVAWNPDGDTVAYVSREHCGDVRLLDLATGEDRSVYSDSTCLESVEWLPIDAEIVCQQEGDDVGDKGIVRIDPRSGDASNVVLCFLPRNR